MSLQGPLINYSNNMITKLNSVFNIKENQITCVLRPINICTNGIWDSFSCIHRFLYLKMMKCQEREVTWIFQVCDGSNHKKCKRNLF